MQVRLRPDDDIVALVRGSVAESLVVIVAAGLDAVRLATVRAALAPLAIESAPRRVNMVAALADADPADVAAAILFLEAAGATTGQWLEVAQRTARRRSQAPSEARTKR